MKKALIFLGITVAVNIIVRLASSFSAGFSEWYAVNIYPVIVNVFARVTGIFPFAVVEILLYMFISAIIAGIVLLVIKLVKCKGRRLKILLKAAVALACTASVLVAMFQFGAGINYRRRPFSEQSGLKPEMYSEEDLRNVIEEVIGELELLVTQINTCEKGVFILNKNEFNATARSAIRQLGEIYPAFDTYYPLPKPVLLSRQILSPAGIVGIFSPFTIEALYNSDAPDSYHPFTALHELSHLSGFMREDEANFIAFLACRNSDSAEFRYSGYIRALSSLLNAYDGEDFIDLLMTIPEQVRMQFYIEHEYWWSFYSTPAGAAIAAASTAINDTYLKTQGQEDGVKSYGRVVDLLIADYIARNKTT
jgi:hypothetical protein